jgi:hypothetical protein
MRPLFRGARNLLDHFSEFLESHVDGAREAVFLLVENASDAHGMLFEFGIGVIHFPANGGGHDRQKRHGRVQFVCVHERAADDFAQHVAAAFVRRDHAIGNQESGSAGVVGDDAQRRLNLRVAHVGVC